MYLKEVLSSLLPSPFEGVLVPVPPFDCQLESHPMDPVDPLFHRQLLIEWVGLPSDFCLHALSAILVRSWTAVMEEPMSLRTVKIWKHLAGTIAYLTNSGHSDWRLCSRVRIATGHLEQGS